MNLAKPKKQASRTRYFGDNVLRCMSPELREKYAPGQRTRAEADEKRQRDTEKEIHAQVRRECLRQKIAVSGAAMNKRSTIEKGHPDLTLMKDNHLLLLELKAEGGRLSTDQIDRIAELKECGNDTVVAYSALEAINAIHAWLARIRH